MPYRFRDARIQSGKNLAEAAEELFVSKTTLSNWESGRRVPSVEAIEKLADLYGVSVDYLLGRTDQLNPLYEVSESVDPHMLQFLHECPVYVNQSRWGLVDAVNHKICFTDGSELAFPDVMQISMLKERSIVSRFEAGKVLHSANPSGMLPKCWRKMFPARLWKISGRST